MKIFLYLVGLLTLFAGPGAALAPAAVDAQGCAGGKCGITTTLTPTAGPTGSQVTIHIDSGGLPVGGPYELWWSKTPTMSDDSTSVKLASGSNPKLAQSAQFTISVPDASFGTSYFHYIRSGKADQMMNFAFQVTPSLMIAQEKVKARSSVTLSGSGFTSSDKISLFIDGEPVAEAKVESDTMGGFSLALAIPEMMAGTHVIKATASKMFNQEATARFKIGAVIAVEPQIPIVGKTATITGYGFAAGTEVSIKYDDKVVTSSPTSDKNGNFSYDFTVPETPSATHTLTATDKAGNVATWELPVENNPPSTPTPISPTSDRLGIIGAQPVTFAWMPSKDDSGRAVYTLEVADNMNFFPLQPGNRRSDLSEATATLNLEPGTYYWRVQAIDASGNKSKWALSPYAFQVGMINLWTVIGASVVLLVIFIFLLRAFIQRIRGYYY